MNAVRSRGHAWFVALCGSEGSADYPPSVRIADATLGTERVRYLAIVPDAASRYPRARHGEVGVEEALLLALDVHRTIAEDRRGRRRPLLLIVDSPGQAYGRFEEALGLHAALAAAVEAYSSARLAGHPLVSLIVGSAMAGAFLAHGYQANHILALDDPGVQIQAMGKKAAARIMRRPVADVEQLARECPPMAYDARTFSRWGLLESPDHPTARDLSAVTDALTSAIADAWRDPTRSHLGPESHRSHSGRTASQRVRQRLRDQWNESR
jgi:biotin-independent malonate decarboxylase gamma subunit